jgi:hypothetical protein
MIRRFPGPITLVPSRAKVHVTALFCGLCATFSIMGTLGAVSHRDARGAAFFAFSAAAFGVWGIITLLSLRPGASSLRLDATGFEVTTFYRTKTYSWTQVGGFKEYRTRYTYGVEFWNKRGVWARPSVSSTDWRNDLLSNTYGLSAEELVHVLVTWQDLAMNTTGPGLARLTRDLEV